MNINIKRLFGVILTILGILGLIYGGVLFVNSSTNSSKDIRALIIYGILGVIFFVSGLGLIRTVKDEA